MSRAQCVPKKLGKYRITVTPKHALHGLVTFHLRGPGVSHVRWFIDTRRAGASGKKWEWLRRGGRDYSVYLWAQERWGEHLWGRHTIEARFRVKDSCGRARAARVQRLYFNHDPLPDDPIFAHSGQYEVCAPRPASVPAAAELAAAHPVHRHDVVTRYVPGDIELHIVAVAPRDDRWCSEGPGPSAVRARWSACWCSGRGQALGSTVRLR